MKDRLFFNPKIQLRKSNIHGWGVFAKDNIEANEILEEIPYLILPINKGESSSLFIDYRFNFPTGNWEYQVIPMGFAIYYNHSNIPNAGWYTDEENDIFVFVSNRLIRKDEEIFTNVSVESSVRSSSLVVRPSKARSRVCRTSVTSQTRRPPSRKVASKLSLGPVTSSTSVVVLPSK